MDDPDIIKELRSEYAEDSKVNSYHFSDKKEKSIYPEDKGDDLRKLFTIAVIIMLVIAGSAILISVFVKQENSFLIEQKNKFIGTWEVTSSYSDHSYYSKEYWTFFENNTLKMASYSNPASSVNIDFSQDLVNYTLTVKNFEKEDYKNSHIYWGSFRLEGGKLFVKREYYSSESDYEYSFSNDELGVVLASVSSGLFGSSSSYSYKTYLTKVTNITESDNFSWSDIRITNTQSYISGNSSYGSGVSSKYNLGVNLTRSSISYSGNSCPEEWGNVTVGDVIEISHYGNINSVSMSIYSSSMSIGSWTFLPDVKYVSEEGLVGYWSFDGQYGNSVFDYSGNNHHTILNGPSWNKNGIINGALYFDGYSDYIKLDEPILNKAPYSICAWIKPNSLTDYNAHYIISNGGQTGSSYGFYLCLYNNMKWRFGAKSSSGLGGSCESSPEESYSPDWTFLCGTWDGSSNSSSISLYVNGELKSQATPTHHSYGDADNLYIGCPSDNYYTHEFAGYIDEVRIYNKTLTETEIEELYLKGIS